jgi:hypothetical protein
LHGSHHHPTLAAPRAPPAGKPTDSDAGGAMGGVRAESLSVGAAPGADAADVDARRARAPSMEDAYTREKAAEVGYDSHGGASTALPVGMTEHLGAAPTRNTASSGSVSGDAWDRDAVTGATEREVEAGIARGRAGGGGGGGGTTSGAAVPVVGSPAFAPPPAQQRQQRQQEGQANLSGL